MRDISLNDSALVVYGVFLFIILAINLLYVFQVLTYRFPGDASLWVLFLHISAIFAILVFSSLLIL